MPVPNYLEGTARRVSMEVYSETCKKFFHNSYIG